MLKQTTCSTIREKRNFDLSQQEPLSHKKQNYFGRSVIFFTSEITSEEPKDLVFSLQQFIQKLESLKTLSDFNGRIKTLWSFLDPPDKFVKNDDYLAGRSCWIDRLGSSGMSEKTSLFRLFKDVFSSTSIAKGAYPSHLHRRQWYRVELAEYILKKGGKGQLRDDPDELLIDMHISEDGLYSGIDWIRSGKGHTGNEVKELAMQIASCLGIQRETLSDMSRLPSDLPGSYYSMKVVFSLIDHPQFPHMSWYERDGFMPIYCHKLVQDNGEKVSQDPIAYFQALNYIRDKSVGKVYSKILKTAVQQKLLLKASRLLFPNMTSDELMANRSTTFSTLLTVLWEKRKSSVEIDRLCYTLYQLLLSNEAIQKAPKDVEWYKKMEIIHATSLFMRYPCDNKDVWLTQRSLLLSQLTSSEAKNSLRQRAQFI